MSQQLRPWQHLPIKMPWDYDPGPEFFYDNIVGPLAEDMIRMMCTGIHIDYDAVEKLRSTIDDVLTNVDATLLRNEIIKKFQEKRAIKAQEGHYAKHTENVRSPEFFLREYSGSVEHRTAVVNEYLNSIGSEKDVKDKWTVKDLKTYNIFKNDSFLEQIIDKSVSPTSKHVLSGMMRLAEAKAELWNRPRYDKANSKAVIDPFNPASAPQKQELFEMLGIEPLAYSDKTGDGSWGRDYVEALQKQMAGSDPVLDEVMQCIIDHSYSGIIRNNFLKAFDTFTIDGVLHGNIRIFGAKSFRPTSNSPNLLNAPSTGSIYAKPLKKCFIAPKGMLIYAIDLSALEDRVIANLSGDENKIGLFLEGLDGHSLNACGYDPERAESIVGKLPNIKETSKAIKKAVDEGNKEAKTFRQWSKDKTFKLSLTVH